MSLQPPDDIEPLYGDVRWPLHEWQKAMAECGDVPRPTIENLGPLMGFLVDEIGISKWQENCLRNDVEHLLRNTEPDDRWKLSLALTTGMRIQAIIDRKARPKPPGGSVGHKVWDIVRRLHRQFPKEKPTVIIGKARSEAKMGLNDKPRHREMAKAYSRMVKKVPS